MTIGDTEHIALRPQKTPPNLHRIIFCWAYGVSIPFGLISGAIVLTMYLAAGNLGIKAALFTLFFGLTGAAFGAGLGMAFGIGHWLIQNTNFLLKEKNTTESGYRPNAARHIKRFVLGSIIIVSIAIVISGVMLFAIPRLVIGNLEQVALCQDVIRTDPKVIADVGTVGTADIMYNGCEYNSAGRRIQNGSRVDFIPTGTFLFKVSGDNGPQWYTVSWEGEGDSFKVLKITQADPFAND